MRKSVLSIFWLVSLVIMAFHTMLHNYTVFNNGETIRVIAALGYKLGLSDYIFVKSLVVLSVVLAGLGSTVVRKTNITRQISIFCIATLLFYLIGFMEPGIYYMACSLLLYLQLCASAYLIGGYIGLGNIVDNSDAIVKVNFMQETRKIENDDSVNIPTKFSYNGKEYDGWINCVNCFRASMVLGTPGSGKTFSFYYHFIEQMISKGYCGLCYDCKYPDLSKIVYNIMLDRVGNWGKMPKFYVINFDDPTKTNRCNPLNPHFMTDIIDAYEAAYMVMINLNKTWIQKQGDFFVESAIVFFTAIIWYLKLYEGGKYCTLPHAIELLMQPYEAVFSMLQKEEDVKNYMSPFINAMEGNAQDQLQGQIASAQIPLTRLSSPSVYWAMSGDDFTLDINNPLEPKIVCIGNNPDRQTIYAAALSLYTSRIFKIINKPGKQKSFVLLDELPTIYLKGLDNLIATARSNRVAIVAGAQDLSQIVRDYGEKEADVIINTIGNVFSGQVKGRTAKMLAETFGKIHVNKKGLSVNDRDSSQSVSFNTNLEDMIPASIISTLSQGSFVGQVADNWGQEISQKFFHARVLANQNVLHNMKYYKEIPPLAEAEGGSMYDIVKQNYHRIKHEISQMVEPYL